MTDSLRSNRPPASGDVPERDREARIEALLLAGLNHYFAEQHELAINVWTRVLFLDRGHAKARAYIERARSAISERQRKGDELLQIGSAALDRGEADVARELVASAVEHGVSHDQALALLSRIDRLETAVGPSLAMREALPPFVSEEYAGAASKRPWKLIGAGVAGGILLGAAVIVLLAQQRITEWPLMPPRPVTDASLLRGPLPVPTTGEVALSRAEALYARGRLHDALLALQGVPHGDPLRTRADEITATIQKQLLSAAKSEESGRTQGDDRRP